MLIRPFIIFLLTCICATMFAQLPSHRHNYVDFKVVTLEDAIKMAREQGKPLFIDSYAKWCTPCKKMDQVFRDGEVAELLNENFVNVKVNMDQPYGKEYQKRYGVVFLPTFLFLDENGNPEIKVDRVLTKYELIAYANHALGKIRYASPPSTQVATTSTTRTTTPTARKTTTVKKTTPTNTTTKRKETVTRRAPAVTTKPVEEEKILYVLEGEDMNPDVLYQEAYFRMQMMDESHWTVAEQYLKTQDQWGTERNMRFIFDFVRHTDSPEFDYIIKNRNAFNKLIGKDNIDRSIDIIVYTRINQGIPRPDLNEAIKLYEYTNASDPVGRAYKYYVKRKIDENDSKNMGQILKDYMLIVENKDAKIVNLYARYVAKSTNKKKELEPAVLAMEKVLSKYKEEADYWNTAAVLYTKTKDPSKAIRCANNAIKLTPQSEQETINYLKDLIRMNR